VNNLLQKYIQEAETNVSKGLFPPVIDKFSRDNIHLAGLSSYLISEFYKMSWKPFWSKNGQDMYCYKYNLYDLDKDPFRKFIFDNLKNKN
jgi:hypothetical protein